MLGCWPPAPAASTRCCDLLPSTDWRAAHGHRCPAHSLYTSPGVVAGGPMATNARRARRACRREDTTRAGGSGQRGGALAAQRRSPRRSGASCRWDREQRGSIAFFYIYKGVYVNVLPSQLPTIRPHLSESD